jgi:hypothetical protein
VALARLREGVESEGRREKGEGRREKGSGDVKRCSGIDYLT